MDAVKEGKTALLHVFDEWADELPKVIADESKFADWAEQGPALIDALGALGPYARMTGTGASTHPAVRTSTRGRGQQRSSTGNGTVTDDQIIAALSRPMNKTQLAEHLGVSRQTIDRRLDKLVREHAVTATGEGSQKRWRARDVVMA